MYDDVIIVLYLFPRPTIIFNFSQNTVIIIFYICILHIKELEGTLNLLMFHALNFSRTALKLSFRTF